MIDSILRQVHGLAVDIVQLSGWLAILSLLFIPLERLFPLHRRRIARRQFGADILYYYVAGLVPAMLMSVPLGFGAYLGHKLLPWQVLHFTATAPFWSRAVAALLLTEVGYYWGHRWTHEIPALWRLHAVHHAPTEIDYLVSTHAHPVDTAFSHLCSLLPIYVLGIAAPADASGSALVVTIGVLGKFWGYFLHANLRLRLGPLEWLISTPAFHHWHHTLEPPVNRNYSAILPWLDRLFGTYYLPRHAWPASYGIDQPMPLSMREQLIEPLMPPISPGGGVAT